MHWAAEVAASREIDGVMHCVNATPPSWGTPTRHSQAEPPVANEGGGRGGNGRGQGLGVGGKGGEGGLREGLRRGGGPGGGVEKGKLRG